MPHLREKNCPTKPRKWIDLSRNAGNKIYRRMVQVYLCFRDVAALVNSSDPKETRFVQVVEVRAAM